MAYTAQNWQRGWPLQLAAVLGDMTPPRAILRLPSGEERVVTAGSMLPDQGIVVMSVGENAVNVARIIAMAMIRATLTAFSPTDITTIP